MCFVVIRHGNIQIVIRYYYGHFDLLQVSYTGLILSPQPQQTPLVGLQYSQPTCLQGNRIMQSTLLHGNRACLVKQLNHFPLKDLLLKVQVTLLYSLS